MASSIKIPNLQVPRLLPFQIMLNVMTVVPLEMRFIGLLSEVDPKEMRLLRRMEMYAVEEKQELC